MALLEEIAASYAGVDPRGDAVAAEAGGDTYLNTGRQALFVYNDGADPRTVTITTTAEVDDQAVADRQISIPAGEHRVIGPLNPAIYNDAEDDTVAVAYDEVTEDTPDPDTQTVFVALVKF